MLVNTGAAAMTDKVLAALSQLATPRSTPPGPTPASASTARHLGLVQPVHQHRHQLARARPRPLRYIVNTSAAAEHVGGNEKTRARPASFRAAAAFGGAVASVGQRASIIAHENVLNRMSAPAGKQPPTPEAAWPTDTYFDEFHKLPAYFNGEAVIVYHAPAANTDGDSFVYFRRSEVISAGNLFSTVSYPLIDLTKGGTIQGVLRRAQPDPRSGRSRVPLAGRHLDRSRRAAALSRYRRRGLVPQHADDDPRPRAGPEGQGHDAGAGQGRAADHGLRRPLRIDHRPVDDGDVRGGGISQPRSGEAPRQVDETDDSETMLSPGGRPLALRWLSRRRARITRTAPPTTSPTGRSARGQAGPVRLPQPPLVRAPCRRPTTRAPSSDGRWSGAAPASWAGKASRRETLKVGDEIVDRRPSLARAGRVPGADGQPEATARRLQLGHALGRSC